MNDDKNLNQPNDNANSEDYQKILDQAAASIKAEDIEVQEIPKEVTTESELTAELKEISSKTTPKEQIKLKDINSPQLEAPDKVQSIPSDIPENKPGIANEELPKTDVQPDVEKHELPPVYNPPKENLDTPEESPKSPEEVKAQIDKILADDSTTTPPKKPNSLKNIFILSLVIFFIVAGLWVYFLFFYQPSTQNSSSVTPTSVPAVTQEVCELNGETYQIGESFKSADGCNTCSCQSAGVIACTEMACSLTPTIVTAPSTKSATISPKKTTITPTKSATSSVTPSTSL